MKVLCLANTMLSHYIPDFIYTAEMIDDADELAEMAGRLCYRSWDRPNPSTATNDGYLKNILNHRHFSVLEHASATFYISGVSRSLTHELVRHRHLSFSQVSQRYVDESENDVVIPPALVGTECEEILRDLDQMAKQGYSMIYEHLRADGLSKKEARQAARSALLGSQSTEIVVSGNLRAWREFVDKRNSKHADREIQLLAQEILRQLKQLAPNSFQDMEV